MKPNPIVLALALAGSSAAAQTQPTGALAGRVVDASSGQPVPAALVSLAPATTGLIFDPRSATLVTVRSMITNDGGAYRFSDVAPGSYRLRVERIGYRRATLEIEVRRPVEARVSIGLELQPIALAAVQVERAASPLFQRAANGRYELDVARVASERMRQALFVAPDARMLTYADVMDGVTLGEGDVFRALQRFPGVGTRDDYTAELWTRGGPWTHTRVTFDGVPLFNPVHAVGVLSAITPEVLGAAFFHPGMRPAAVGGGAAGVVDLRSRPGDGDGGIRGVADLSMATSKLVLEQRQDHVAWLIAARRSHLGLLTDGLGSIGLDTLDLPYVFHDLAGRGDIELGAHTTLELSGLWEQDRIEGDVAGVLERNRARWGNTAGRALLRSRIGGVAVSQTVGGSMFSARTDERLVRITRTRQPVPTWTEPASTNDITYLQFAGQIAQFAGNQPPRWSVGYDIAAQSVSYDGPLPRYYAVQPDTAARVQYDRDLRVLGLWADARLEVGSWLTVNPGLRVETGDAIADAARLRLAPQLAVRLAFSSDHTISLGAGRSFQYVQAIALAGPSIHPAFHASHYWLFADEETPAMRTDIVSAGTERWLGDGWLASLGAFARRSVGLTVPNPDSGSLRRRKQSVEGELAARGIEVSLRRIGARWSTALGYTLGDSKMEASGLRYPSPADRRQVVDAMLGAYAGRGWRVAAAYTAMTGAPYTRAYSRSQEDCTSFGFGCSGDYGGWVQEHNAERTPVYLGLDASVQWARTLGHVQLTAYGQVRNVLGRENASTYSGTVPIEVVTRRGVNSIRWDDRFEKGLPRLPLFGLRVNF